MTDLIRQWVRIAEEGGVLYWQMRDPNAPEERRMLLLSRTCLVSESLHDKAGYQGMECTEQLVRGRGWWPGLRKDVKEWIDNCERCALAKGPYLRTSQESDEINLCYPAIRSTRSRLYLVGSVFRW